MTDEKTPWSLSWFRAQGFDCDLDASFDFLEEKLQSHGSSSEVIPSSMQKSLSQRDLQLTSLELCTHTNSSSISDSDESQLELISQTLSQLASQMRRTQNTSYLTEHVSDRHVTDSVLEASRLLQSIDHSIALASSAPPVQEAEPPIPVSHCPVPKPIDLIDNGLTVQTLPMKRVNLIAGELKLLQYKISVAEIELEQARKALVVIPDTNMYRKQLLLEKYATISAQLKTFREQWRLIAKEQTAQLNEMRHSIVYYNIYTDPGHKLHHIDSYEGKNTL